MCVRAFKSGIIPSVSPLAIQMAAARTVNRFRSTESGLIGGAGTQSMAPRMGGAPPSLLARASPALAMTEERGPLELLYVGERDDDWPILR